MTLGIMQPYFFPYLGYFDLINYADRWIVFDAVQYIRHGWINRNRILHPQKEWLYITAPVKASREVLIMDVQVVEGNAWKQRILGQLGHYKKKAWRHFPETKTLVEQVLDTTERSISKLNVRALQTVCKRLDVPFDYAFFSEMDLALGPIEEPGDWALRICEALEADEYVNPPGGADLFDRDAFAASGIELTIRNVPPFEYEARGYTFVPNLSILDVMMWNKPAAIKQYLDAIRCELQA